MKFLLTLLTYGIVAGLYAQNPSPKNEISLLNGYYNAVYKDIHFSPLHYSTNSYAVNIDYKRNSEQFEIYGNLNSSVSKLKTEVADVLQTTRYYFNIEFGFLKHLAKDSENWQFSVGGQLHSYGDVADFNSFGAVTFFGFHSLDISGQACYKVNEQHAIQSRLSVPLLGILVRPPYSGWNKEIYEASLLKILYTGSVTSFNQYQGISSITRYQFHLSEKWALNAEYSLRFNATKQRALARNLNSQLLFGASLKF